MTATLTERYIAATVRTLPSSAQDDVRSELLASIADDIDARVEQGEQHEAAERAVITALGDPDALAAGYVDRPLHLLGPKYYLLWWRLLKLLWIIVPICAVVGVTIAELIEDAAVAEVIASALAAGVGAIVHVGFWTTIVFVILERTGADTGVEWTPDNLPEPQESGAGRGDLIASLVFLGLLAAALLWDRFVGFALVADGGVDVGVGLREQTNALSTLNPDLWPWWLGGLLALLAVEAGLAIAVYARRGWTMALATLNTLLAAAIAILLLFLLVTGQLFNPAFLEFTLGRSDVPVDVERILAILLAVTFIGIAVWDSVDGWRKAHRAR